MSPTRSTITVSRPLPSQQWSAFGAGSSATPGSRRASRRSSPLFLVHGDADPVAPHQELLEPEARARRVGVPVTLHTVAGAGHGFFGINLRAERVGGTTLFDHIRDFLKERLALGG